MDKRILDFNCIYPKCGRKDNIEELKSRGYITELNDGRLCVECPKCGGQQIAE